MHGTWKKYDDLTSEMRDLNEKGWSLRRIAKHLDLSLTSVRRRIRPVNTTTLFKPPEVCELHGKDYGDTILYTRFIQKRCPKGCMLNLGE